MKSVLLALTIMCCGLVSRAQQAVDPASDSMLTYSVTIYDARNCIICEANHGREIVNGHTVASKREFTSAATPSGNCRMVCATKTSSRC